MAGRETQDFASLQGLRHWVNDEGLKDNVATYKSRDARFCVSRGRNAIIVKRLLNASIAMGWTGDARFCVSTGLTPLSE